MEDIFKKTGMELEGHEACVSLQYNFDKTGGTFALFNESLKVFTKAMLFGDKGGEITMSYSQKVESKKLGNVAGILGVLKWHTDLANILPEEFEFLLTEHEMNLPTPFPQESSECCAMHRGIRISLRPKTGSVSAATVKILKMLDSKFTSNFKHLQRCVPCKKCIIDGKYGYFPLEEGMRLSSAHSRCSQNLEHTMDERLIEIMQKAQEPESFQLKPLMETKKEDLGLEAFETSEIKRKMDNGELNEGEQIWVFHDTEINPNAIAKIMAYSHCLVYIGSKKGEDGEEILDSDGRQIHEVVHATFAGISKLVRSTGVVDKIARVNVMSAIKPNDMVFLGHRIKECQYSANARKMIVERAIACAEKPHILFDYDHRSNCETFCNMIVFGKAESTQTKGTEKSIKRAFKFLSKVRRKSRKPLCEQIQQRLRDRGLM